MSAFHISQDNEMELNGDLDVNVNVDPAGRAYICSFFDQFGIKVDEKDDIDFLLNEVKLMLSILINDSFLFGTRSGNSRKLSSHDIECALKMKNYNDSILIGSQYEKKYDWNKIENVISNKDSIIKLSNLLAKNRINNGMGHTSKTKY